MSEIAKKNVGPLTGVRVLELGQLIAGPFGTAFLAWFGAEVIKVEPPGTGDPLRTWRVVHEGTSLWWRQISRNKKCVTLNLRVAEGQKIARELAKRVDVVVENFRPGTLEKWGLGFEELKKENPKLILARISGYGQTGPYAQRPGFAAVAEAFGGLRYVTGEPDRPPVRPNLSLGDSVAGLHAALGILMALYHRDARGGSGQVIDVALYETVLNLMEGMIPEFDKAGVKREREGMRLTGIVPSGTYLCADGAYIVIGANGDSIFKRFMLSIGRVDLAGDARLASNEGRSKHIDEIDDAIAAWTKERAAAEALRVLSEADVPSGPIYSAAEMLADLHYKARGVFEDADLGDGDRVKLPRMAPQMGETPGEMRWIGPALGAHNTEVYQDWLGYPAAELERLSKKGVI
ncbi:MAG TPA: CaiB/BaiF CoA-transferase family protein [Candidatus Dormibacteraeota bacterium]|jgi:formyl-CoA transferase|nr:CaiB/BaiF CoA-transferase family protein [Candidatus Dormibacteraeota bacterium]